MFYKFIHRNMRAEEWLVLEEIINEEAKEKKVVQRLHEAHILDGDVDEEDYERDF